MSENLLAELRRRIVFLEYLPGTVLSPKSLAESFDVSTTPIREALIRLEEEGLVRRLPNRSLQVEDVSLFGVKGLFEVKLLLNQLVGKLAAQRITEAELQELRKLLKKIKRTERRKQLLVLDEEMHEVIDGATRNEELCRIQKRQRAHISRLWFYINQHTSYEDQIINDFEKLIPALESRDETLASQILEEHLGKFIPIIQGVIGVDSGPLKTASRVGCVKVEGR